MTLTKSHSGVLVFLASMLLASATLCAQIEKKIGFVHLQNSLQGTEESKAEIARIQKFVEAKNSEQDGMISEIDRQTEEIKTKGRTLNQATLAQMQRDLEEKQTALRRFQEDTQKEIDRLRDELLRKYGQKMQEVIREYAVQNGFDVIYLLDALNYGYISEDFDLTEKIIGAYNLKYPVGSASSSSSGAAPPSN